MFLKFLPLIATLTAAPILANEFGGSNTSLEPAINGGVSASGVFPTQEIEDEFLNYLRWTKENGLSRLVAFEPLIENGSGFGYRFPTPSMERQFVAYLRWVEDQGRSPFYAFRVSNFD